MWKSKFIWLNVIAIVILIVQYSLDNAMVPASWVPFEGLIIVVLNAISGMLQSVQVAKLKAQLKKR